MGTPLELPYPLPAKSTKFDLVRRQQNSPVGSGFIQVINRAMPFWAGEWESPPLQELKRGQLEAILEEIEMGTGTFYGFDPRRPKPMHTEVQPMARSLGAPLRVSRVYRMPTRLSAVTSSSQVLSSILVITSPTSRAIFGGSSKPSNRKLRMGAV